MPVDFAGFPCDYDAINRLVSNKDVKNLFSFTSLEQEKLNKDRDQMRKSLVSTGDRSAKIRTYNFPQGRITDHRINYTSHKFQDTLEGDLDHIIEKLKLEDDNSKIN